MRPLISLSRFTVRRLALATLATALLFAGTTFRAIAQIPVSPLTVSETQVVMFAPPLPAGDAIDGSCWTTSIAVPRPGAYRCKVGNAISDPCFMVPPNRDLLVCDADPALKKDGFALKLTKPLPRKVPRASESPEPWILRLADSSICEAMTGTLPAVNGEPARWSCAVHIRDTVKRTGVVTRVTRGKIWMAERYSADAVGNPASGFRRLTAEQVPIKMVWE
jgi:hypothetical protein